ncbi:phage tail tape measure protein [Dysgonomonas sp. Marseille-P4677]|uniref:phage tail tape measure protein n=1 Tax=Dysgonomonas sp. Marseille-P4677 TaxID=2364790 RepID=UPI0019126B71|nr:phage tail tape measure protein [Dysgonomonas sp. Marseille-P4677]MBK5720146.1 phage tail tape measure protein [Dysgonomonas sp. Marseille-P4677]
MAKDLNRSIKIYIDNSDAMKKSSDFANRIEKVKQKLEELNAQGKKGSPEYKKAEDELRKLTASYDRYQAKLKDTERVLKNLSGATRGELEALKKELTRSLKNVAQGTEEYKAKVQALIAVEKQLSIVKKEQNGTLSENESMWSRAAGGFNKYFGIVTSIVAGITGLSFTLRKLSEDVAKMDDVYADVMKTTNLTRDEVVDLNESFKQMDTRTAREELNNLARDAGKLGINASKDILDFVEAGNQINVALGEDLGEGAIKNIGKMTDVYKLSTKELENMDLKGKMLAIGSAINDLGMTSTASEAYMVSFTQRLGGVASQAGISIQNILGYASALDQSGQSVEMSATALQNFIMKLMGEPSKFAKLAGLEVKAFNQLLQTDTNAAIKQVLTALSEKGGFQALIPVFKDMGLDGARAVGVLSALASNIDKVNTAQEISNKAFVAGTSITDEYSIKNNNLNAQLEKARKNFKDASLELGETLNPVLLTSTKWTTYLIKALPTVISFFEKYGKYLLYLTVVYGLYIAGVKTAAGIETVYNGILTIGRLRRIQIALASTQSTAAQTLYNSTLQNGSLITRAYTAVTSLFSAAKFLLTGNITKARIEMQAFNTATKLNPAGLATALIMALAAAMAYLFYKTSQVITAQKAIKEATQQFNGELAKEQSEVNRLFYALKSANPESEEFRKIRNKIISQYGPYIRNLINEKGEIINISLAHQQVNDKLREQIALKIKNAASSKILEKSIEDQRDGVSSVIKNVQKQLSLSDDMASDLQANINKIITDFTTNKGWENNRLDLNKKIKDHLDAFAGLKKSIDYKYKSNFFGDILNIEIESLTSNITRAGKEIKSVENQFKGLISQATEVQNIIGDGDDNDDGGGDKIPPVDPDKDLVAKQKKELDLILENLETKHQDRLHDIKKKYQSGEIDSESEFNSQIFAQSQAYYILQEQALTEYLEKVSDKALRSDIQKQISDVQNKQLDETLKHQKAVEQIILDADPEKKEKLTFENRLREAGLYGIDRENLTKDQLEALELLEKQHNDNLVQIRKDDKAKKKAASEEEFEESFTSRKEQLQQEITAEEQRVSVLTGIGALSGENAFNAEVELQRKRIALIREEIAARQKAGLDVTKLMQKQRSDELSLTQLYVNEYKRRTQQFAQYGESMGNSLGNAINNQENLLAAFADTAIDILFDVLSQIISAEIAKVTAVGVGAIAQTTAKEISSKSFAGIATAAVLTGAIMAAMTVAKTALKGMLGKKNSVSTSSSSSTTTQKRVVSQQAAGKYDVIGADDGKLYRNVPFAGSPKTGIVTQPTLIAEDGGELVVSSPDLKALQKHMNYPYIVKAINDVRAGTVQQRASGNYENINTSQVPVTNDGVIIPVDILHELVKTMKEVRDKELDFNIYDFEKKKKTVDNARNLGKRK